MKKLFSFMFAVATTVLVNAQDYSGTCGENLQWTFNGNVLSITGSGEMDDYAYDSNPWSEYRDLINQVVLPDGLTSIGQYAFYGCYNLTSINIPASVTKVGNNAFGDCSSLPVEDNIRYADTYLVKVVNKQQASYTIKEGTRWIGRWAFEDCNMTSITLPNSVTFIESGAFQGCKNLTSITLSNSLVRIDDYAFAGWKNLSSITIPENLQEIGGNVFSECTGLRTVVWNAKNAKRREDDYGASIFYYELAPNITSFTFGNAVEVIPDRLCQNMTQLTSINLPNSVTTIGDGSFNRCQGVEAIIIPKNVKSIGDEAFEGCSSLQYINFLGTSLKSIGSYAFASCVALKSINLPNSVETLGRVVFGECTFSSIIIPQSVKEIGEYAFAYNRHLKSVTISNQEALCEKSLFSGCDSLESLIVPANALSIDIVGIDGMPSHVRDIKVTEGELSETAFAFITHSYKTIQSIDCGAATNTFLYDEAFKGCYNLQSLILPQNLTYVSYMAVAGCKNLKSIDIPASVEEIEQSAFEDCRSLEELTFAGKKPSSAPNKNQVATATSKLRKIGNWAFYNAHELQHLEIPEGVTEIGDAAFYGCTYLQDLVLPSSVKSIGDNCFALCSKLQQITITSVTPPSIAARTFYDVSRAIPVLVPDESVDDYLDAPYWSEMNIQGGATALDQITNDQLPITNKVIKDGQLFILRSDKTYTVTGQEVK